MLRIASLDEHCETTRYDQLSETMLVDLSARRRHADHLVEHHLGEAGGTAAIATSGTVDSRCFPSVQGEESHGVIMSVGGGRRRCHGVPW